MLTVQNPSVQIYGGLPQKNFRGSLIRVLIAVAAAGNKDMVCLLGEYMPRELYGDA